MPPHLKRLATYIPHTRNKTQKKPLKKKKKQTNEKTKSIVVYCKTTTINIFVSIFYKLLKLKGKTNKKRRVINENEKNKKTSVSLITIIL